MRLLILFFLFFYLICLQMQFPDLITVSGIMGKVVGWFYCQLQDSVSDRYFSIKNCFFRFQESDIGLASFTMHSKVVWLELVSKMSKELLDANSIVFVLPAFLSSGYVRCPCLPWNMLGGGGKSVSSTLAYEFWRQKFVHVRKQEPSQSKISLAFHDTCPFLFADSHTMTVVPRFMLIALRYGRKVYNASWYKNLLIPAQTGYANDQAAVCRSEASPACEDGTCHSSLHFPNLGSEDCGTHDLHWSSLSFTNLPRHWI